MVALEEKKIQLLFPFSPDAIPVHVNISSGCIFNAQILAFLSVKQ